MTSILMTMLLLVNRDRVTDPVRECSKLELRKLKISLVYVVSFTNKVSSSSSSSSSSYSSSFHSRFTLVQSIVFLSLFLQFRLPIRNKIALFASYKSIKTVNSNLTLVFFQQISRDSHSNLLLHFFSYFQLSQKT